MLCHPIVTARRALTRGPTFVNQRFCFHDRAVVIIRNLTAVLGGTFAPFVGAPPDTVASRGRHRAAVAVPIRVHDFRNVVERRRFFIVDCVNGCNADLFFSVCDVINTKAFAGFEFFGFYFADREFGLTRDPF